MLLAGLWCDNEKPPSFTFLEPMLTTLQLIKDNGMYKIWTLTYSYFVYIRRSESCDSWRGREDC